LAEAIADASRIIEAGRGDGRIYSVRGCAYLDSGETQKAIADLTAAIRLEPNWQFHYLNRADAYRRAYEFGAAEADERKAKELRRDSGVE